MTLDKIQFEPHPIAGGKMGRVFFPNGYGASIVGGASGLYGDGVNTFELAVLKGSKDDWDLCYDTPITDDVMGWRSEAEINEILAQIEQL